MNYFLLCIHTSISQHFIFQPWCDSCEVFYIHIIFKMRSGFFSFDMTLKYSLQAERDKETDYNLHLQKNEYGETSLVMLYFLQEKMEEVTEHTNTDLPKVI